MRYLIWIFFVLALAASCASDEQGEASQEEFSEKIRKSASATTSSPEGVPASAKNGSFQPPQPVGGGEKAQLLTQNFWVFEFYVTDDKATRLAQKGNWYRFFKDGTFESGNWTDKTGYGSWRLQNVPDEGLMLFMDNINDELDIQWEIQGINKAGDTMTWAGINRKANAGDVVKVISLLTRPTRKQFGVEEPAQ